MEGVPRWSSFSYLLSKPSMCTSCSPAQVLVASKVSTRGQGPELKPLPSMSVAPTLHCRCSLYLPLPPRNCDYLRARPGPQSTPPVLSMILLQVWQWPSPHFHSPALVLQLVSAPPSPAPALPKNSRGVGIPSF